MAATGYTPVQLYRSTTPSQQPSAINLADGELAINTYDKKLYAKDSSGNVFLLASEGGTSGTVSTVSVVSANGFAGTVANATTTPAITLTTSITGVLKGNGTAISAASAGTDYVEPGGALGTPSSGTVTNLTGTASININGTVGATTPTTGAFTQVDITAQGDLRFQDSSGGEYVGFQAPATVASNVLWTLPSADGTSNQVLSTNGSGTLSWATIAAQTYPGAGIPNSTGSAWGTSYTTSGSGTVVALATSAALTTPTITGTKETKVAMAADDIDLATGNVFTKTITTTTTLTVSNVATTGTVNAFLLELTNGGSSTVNWFSGVDWPAGTAPTLTAAGKDVLGFFTYDGGTTWNGFTLGLDVK